MYFVPVIAVCVLNEVLSRAGATNQEVATGFRKAVPIVLANRLMINIRYAYYDEGNEERMVSASILFAQPRSRKAASDSTASFPEDTELQAFE
ncbi:hypothetical protein GLOTRDRAFT_139032 [Gloeophyllum trabeum ATCC 11539]|uniref:Uncharacterized protein n=1 Tax=Gloeophyllum trabeum (strain ATCC 11539 / FP-39264 / Madison 617) TaxID=670483 RepID=S7RJD3_GLOTA|nr:uncharacterized protein GLOTRDRAFT_139032 [Gloeophyllum trabeum ATCC 11539]EPQ54445.1 hypothetical protein GLOTRDRAFT_139032 [Gloeophyllum trabeum ATCC 11539]